MMIKVPSQKKVRAFSEFPSCTEIYRCSHLTTFELIRWRWKKCHGDFSAILRIRRYHFNKKFLGTAEHHEEISQETRGLNYCTCTNSWNSCRFLNRFNLETMIFQTGFWTIADVSLLEPVGLIVWTRDRIDHSQRCHNCEFHLGLQFWHVLLKRRYDVSVYAKNTHLCTATHNFRSAKLLWLFSLRRYPHSIWRNVYSIVCCMW